MILNEQVMCTKLIPIQIQTGGTLIRFPPPKGSQGNWLREEVHVGQEGGFYFHTDVSERSDMRLRKQTKPLLTLLRPWLYFCLSVYRCVCVCVSLSRSICLSLLCV